jgi:hypothetical protein
MSTPVNNLALELLRALRDHTVAIRADLTEAKHRLSNLEISVATIRCLIAHNGAETSRQAAAQD